MKRGMNIILIGILLVLPLISAYSFGLQSPFEYFDNEWVIFSILVLILFATFYSFFKNKMQSAGSAGILSLGLSILISIPIVQRGILDKFLNETMVDLIILIALIALISFLFFKFSFRRDGWGIRRFSKGRFFSFLVIGSFILALIKDYLPEMIIDSPIGDAINGIENLGWSLVIIIIIIFAGYWILKFFLGRRSMGGGGGNAPRNWGGGIA